MIGLGQSSDSWAERLAAKTTLYNVLNILISHSFTLCYECVRKSRPSYWFEFEIVLAQVLIDNPGNARKLKFVKHLTFSVFGPQWKLTFIRGLFIILWSSLLARGFTIWVMLQLPIEAVCFFRVDSNLILQDSFGFYSHYFVSHSIKTIKLPLKASAEWGLKKYKIHVIKGWQNQKATWKPTAKTIIRPFLYLFTQSKST